MAKHTLDERPEVTIKVADLSTDPNEVCLEIIIRGADEAARNKVKEALLEAMESMTGDEP